MNENLNIVLLFLDHYLAVECVEGPTGIKRPDNVDAQPVSSSQVIVVWDKELGFGYNYRLNVLSGTETVQVITGSEGFGNAEAVTVRGLLPSKPYSFSVELECASKPGTFSKPRSIKKPVTTLAVGKSFCRIM